MRIRLYVLGTELIDLVTGADAADVLGPEEALELPEMTGGPVAPAEVSSEPQDPLTGFHRPSYEEV